MIWKWLTDWLAPKTKKPVVPLTDWLAPKTKKPVVPCPICDQPMKNDGVLAGLVCGGNDERNGSHCCELDCPYWYGCEVLVSYYRYTIDKRSYCIRYTDTDQGTVRLYSRPAGMSSDILTYRMSNIEYLSSDIDFDPKHPQPTIDRIRLLEAFV